MTSCSFCKNANNVTLYCSLIFYNVTIYFVQALEECVDEGLVKHIGLSNFNSEQIQKVIDHARIKPAAIQVNFPMLDANN